MAPHNCYPCADDEWISIAVRTDEQWRGLCAALDAKGLAANSAFATLAGRQANPAALDKQLSGYTHQQYASLLGARLRKAGVPAFKSQTALDLVGDEHLWRRDIFTTVSDAAGRLRPIVGAAWRLLRGPASVTRAAPRLGEHNAYVYRNLLGLSQAQLQALIEQGVVD